MQRTARGEEPAPLRLTAVTAPRRIPGIVRARCRRFPHAGPSYHSAILYLTMVNHKAPRCTIPSGGKHMFGRLASVAEPGGPL
jgi:hypothetical protein